MVWVNQDRTLTSLLVRGCALRARSSRTVAVCLVKIVSDEILNGRGFSRSNLDSAINLPTALCVTEEQIEQISDTLKSLLANA